ncbi:MAG: hypothetical protein LBQ43_04550 [Holosporales bacterium]|jgi:hypothetical protein|nr:hypothetical protein [Holosporales bacterium]
MRNKQKVTPFDFLNIPVSFLLDEANLRAQYFRVCEEQRNNPSALALAHKHYQTLLDPIARLDCLLAHFFRLNHLIKLDGDGNNRNENNDSLDFNDVGSACLNESDDDLGEDIVNLYNEVLMLLPEEVDAFVLKMEELNQTLLHEIQLTYERRDVRMLRRLRGKLAYYKKISDAAYSFATKERSV